MVVGVSGYSGDNDNDNDNDNDCVWGSSRF